VTLMLDGARPIVVQAVDSADKPLPGIDLTPWTVRKKAKLGAVNFPAGLKGVSAQGLRSTDRPYS